MKSQQADTNWCLANRELVMRWLEKRGGLRFGDRVWIRRQSKAAIVQRFYAFTDH